MDKEVLVAIKSALSVLGMGLHPRPRQYQQQFDEAMAVIEKHLAVEEPRIYPCNDCGTMRTKSEGGTTFTVCDTCWDKNRDRKT